MMYNDYQRERKQNSVGELGGIVGFRIAELIKAKENAEAAIPTAAPNIDNDVAAQVIDLATRRNQTVSPNEEPYMPFSSSVSGDGNRVDAVRDNIAKIYQDFPAQELRDVA